MSFSIGAPVPWSLPPDWSTPVRERLAWLTDVQRGGGGAQSKRRLRLSPRRGFSFSVLCGPDPAERRLADALRFDHGHREWLLPIWPDVHRVSGLSAGAEEIVLDTEDLDYTAGGRALVWRSPRAWEIVEIESVDPDALRLAGALANAWPAGTRVYPVVRARVRGTPDEQALTDRHARLGLDFEVVEPCDWPAAMPPTLYRGAPILEIARQEPTDPASGYARDLDWLDVGTGAPMVFDDGAMPFRYQDHHLTLHGRKQRADLRSLLNALSGRYQELWVPSYMSDLELVAPVADTASVLHVQWCGYSVFGRQQGNRRDLRIELSDGQSLYRRITGATETGETEQLSLDTPLGIPVSPAHVRRISFVSWCQLASDAVEIDHVTDSAGVAECALRWEAIRRDD